MSKPMVATAPLMLGLDAMHTRFELVMYGTEPRRLQAIGEAALSEIESCSRHLDRFRNDSWIAQVERKAGDGSQSAPAELLALLSLCQEIHRATNGAFDPVVHCCGAAITSVRLDLEGGRLEFRDPALRLDFGGIAKGWAIDRAVAVLREQGVANALLHGGTSTCMALGAPPTPVEGRGWRIALENHASIELRDCALALSSNAARAHVVDPAHGEAVVGQGLAAVCAPSAALADAWSTACLVRSPTEFTFTRLP